MIERCLAPGVVLLLLAPAVAGAQSLPGPENYHVRGEYTRWSPGLDSQIQKGFGDAAGIVPLARFLDDATLFVEDFHLTLNFVMERFFHGFKGIQIFDVRFGAEFCVAHRAKRYIGVAA